MALIISVLTKGVKWKATSLPGLGERYSWMQENNVRISQRDDKSERYGMEGDD